MKQNKRNNKNKVSLSKSIITLMVIILLMALSYIVNNPYIIPNDKKIAKNYSRMDEISEYSGQIYVEINNNNPYFSEEDYTKEAFEKYSNLDEKGRCGVAYANICKEIMPKDGETRGSISNVKPTGWKQKKYAGEYLYNRCHLIGYQLSAENANERNLITGTKYFNVQGMLPFENKVANYINENKNAHVLYRVTPNFKGDNLLASGVEIEAYSVEDNGKGICFNVYIYNVQPEINIDYKTGESNN